MNKRVIEIVKEKLDEEREKLKECTRKRQFDVAIVHSVRIDTLYWFLSILEGRRTKNE